MADAKKINIRISTTADTSGADAAVKSLDQVEREAKQAGKAVGGAATPQEEFRKEVQKAEEPVKRLRKGMDATGKSSANMGRAVLEGSRAFEDMQYGIRGVLNNIPGLVMALGGTAGIAGAASLAAVGISVLAPRIKEMLGEAEDSKALRELEKMMMDATQATIEMADKQREAAAAEKRAGRAAYENAEAIREMADAQNYFNSVAAESIGLLEEQQRLENQLADERGRTELEGAGTEVEKVETENRLRKEAQERELRQIEELQKKRRDLLTRLDPQQSELATRRDNRIGALETERGAVSDEALQQEQLAKLKNDEAEGLRNVAEKQRGPQRGATNRLAVAAEKLAKEAAAKAKELRDREGQITEEIEAVRTELDGKIEAIYEEMNRVYKELERVDRETANKKQVFAERDKRGEIRLGRARETQANREEDDAKSQAGERLGEVVEDKEAARDATSRERGLSIRKAGLRRGDSTLQTVGKALADGTNEAELTKLGDLVAENQRKLGANTVAALRKVIGELQRQQQEINVVKEQIKNNRTR